MVGMEGKSRLPAMDIGLAKEMGMVLTEEGDGDFGESAALP